MLSTSYCIMRNRRQGKRAGTSAEEANHAESFQMFRLENSFPSFSFSSSFLFFLPSRHLGNQRPPV